MLLQFPITASTLTSTLVPLLLLLLLILGSLLRWQRCLGRPGLQLEVLSHWRLALVRWDVRHGRALAHHRGVDHQPHVAQSATRQPSICIPPSVHLAPPLPAHTQRESRGEERDRKPTWRGWQAPESQCSWHSRRC